MIHPHDGLLTFANFILAFTTYSLLAIASAAVDGDNTLFINCGAVGHAVDDSNQTWVGDIGSGSQLTASYSCSHHCFTAVAPNKDHHVPAIPFLTARVSSTEFAYSLPVPPGRVSLRLYFYPSDYLGRAAATAVFHVAAGPHILLANFAPSLAAEDLSNGSRAVVVREFCLNATFSGLGGFLRLTFTPSDSDDVHDAYAFVNGIELVAPPVPDLVTPLPLLPLRESSSLYASTWGDDFVHVFGAAVGISWQEEEGREIEFPPRLVRYYSPHEPDPQYATLQSVTADMRLARSGNPTWVLPLERGFYYSVRLRSGEIRQAYDLRGRTAFDAYINRRAVQIGEKGADRAASCVSGTPGDSCYITFMPDGVEKLSLWLQLHPDISARSEYVDAVVQRLEAFKVIEHDDVLPV